MKKVQKSTTLIINEHFRMISEWSCDTDDRSNGWWKFCFASHKYIWEYIIKRSCQLFFLLRQLSGLGVSKHISELVYKSIVESVLTFHLSVWYEHLNCRLENKLSRIVSSANKIIGRPQNQLTQLYVESTKKKARVILADGSYPRFSQFELLKSGRLKMCLRGPSSPMQLESLIQ